MNLRDDPACIHHFRNRGNENQKEEVTWERVHSYSGPLSTLKKKKKKKARSPDSQNSALAECISVPSKIIITTVSSAALGRASRQAGSLTHCTSYRC